MVIEKDGLVDGTILADDVVIAGMVEGKVNARTAEIIAGAEVKAEVAYDQISVTLGAVHLGKSSRAECLQQSPRCPTLSRRH